MNASSPRMKMLSILIYLILIKLISWSRAWEEIKLWNSWIFIFNTIYITDGRDGALKEVILAGIIDGLKIELNTRRAITLNNLREIYKARMIDHGISDPQTDETLYINLQCLFTKQISCLTDGAKLEKGFERNQCQNIYIKDGNAISLKYADKISHY